MIVDPVDVLMKTSSLLVPTNTGSPVSPTGHHPLPTIVPDKPEYQEIHQDGARALWVVFVIMVIASAAFAAMSWTVPVSKRLFHIITTLITITAAISYFGMASGHGVTLHYTKVREEHKHVDDTFHEVYRQVFWARYVDWAITTPLLLLDLSLLAGLSGAHILMAVIADVIMILTGLFAALGSEGTPQKWGWYAIACISYLVIIWHLAINGRSMAMKRTGKVGPFFTAITAYTLIIWTAYPIIWGIADGSRKMSVDGEIIAYAVLDILAKPVFGAWLLLTHMRMPETNIDLGGFWSTGFGDGRIRIGDDEDGA
ncbi:family A G protein-coupled receptor-like protein [Aulographum hederae CBS 113979]|uniref:Family A G protein-coupled receptor-like protein n=1 Tax=Aulographum hederae CBS 113979 TaxID=1176131 RepID=A0A6G1GIW0_9PEZI|nr:family A G protein-coupled receptor-like protein [Aulographum hederae CBS 113979]